MRAPALAQESLRQTVRRLADDARGTVYVACALPGSALNCDLRPLGLAVLHRVEQGRWSLEQPIRFLPTDRILPHAYSPLQEKYPQAGVDVPLSELLRLTVSLSDNVAADILLRVLGSEAVLHRRMRAQYHNYIK